MEKKKLMDVYHLHQNCGKFGQSVNGKIILAGLTTKFSNKHNVLKGTCSPQFPMKHPSSNCAYQFQFFTIILELLSG